MLAELLFAEKLQLRANTLESWTGGLDNLPDDIWDAMVDGGSGTSDAGLNVSRKTALENDAWWRGVNLVSGDLASTPRHVYRRIPGGGKERDLNHPAERLIRRKPNPQIKAFDFYKTLQAHVMGHGNGYAYIVRNGDGSPAELWPMSPEETFPERKNGVLEYVHRVAGLEFRLPYWDVVHIRGLGFDGLVGYSVRSYARHALGLADAMRKHASYFFKQGAQPSLVVKHPGELSLTARKNIADGMQKLYGGIEKRHLVAVLDQAMEVTTLPIDERKAQLLEGRRFSVREIANFLSIPPHKLGDDSRISYNSLESEDKAYLQQALNPWFVQWEEELGDKLLTEPQLEGDSHFIEFVREALISVDYATKVNGVVTLVNNGLKTLDEGRALFNDPPVPDGEGQKFRKPENIGIIGEEPEPEPAPAPQLPPAKMLTDESEMDRKKAIRQIALNVFQRVGRRMGERARRAATDRGKLQAKVLAAEWDAEYVQEIAAGVAPVLCLLGANPDGRAAVLATTYVGRWKSRLTIASTVADTELRASVEAAAGYLESELAEEMADEIVEI